MIERVTLAIAEAMSQPGDALTLCENAARAAISAMREPTADMVKKAVPAPYDSEFYAADRFYVLTPITEEEVPVAAIYRAMIDASLSPDQGQAGEGVTVIFDDSSKNNPPKRLDPKHPGPHITASPDQAEETSTKGAQPKR